jgi:CelD/BcsL family acetyltransferase involved in cellulose biosynthesis
LLRLYALALGGRAVAVLYGLAGPGTVYYYLGGYEPGLDGLGLGTILIGHAIAEAERAGATQFDFLRGQESYKYHWGGIDRPSFARLLTPPAGDG